MRLRQSISATAAFFSARSARIDKVVCSWRECYVFQLYLPDQGKKWLVCSLENSAFTALICDSPFPSGDGPVGNHWRSLRIVLKGGVIAGAVSASGERGLELWLKRCRARRLILHAGQMTALGSDGATLWSLRPGRRPASLRFIEQEAGCGKMMEAGQLAGLLFESVRARRLKEIRREKKKAERALAKVLVDRARFEQADIMQQRAELLKSQLYLLHKGDEEAVLQDYFSVQGGEVRLPLDPTLSPQDNMQRLFKKALKYRRGQDIALQREAALRETISKLEDDLEEARVLDFSHRALLFVSSVRIQKKGDRGEAGQLPYRTFPGNGWTIYAGKNDRGNETVTFKLAGGNDIWVHARNYPGSHVVVKPHKKGTLLPEEVYLKAAKLALFYSPVGKAGGREEVVLIEVKHVRKIHGGRAAQVTYGKGRTLMVTLEAGFRPGSLFQESQDT